MNPSWKHQTGSKIRNFAPAAKRFIKGSLNEDGTPKPDRVLSDKVCLDLL